MIERCKDCGREVGHQRECPAQEYPSLLIEQQIESDKQPPIQQYRARREVKAWIQGEKIK